MGQPCSLLLTCLFQLVNKLLQQWWLTFVKTLLSWLNNISCRPAQRCSCWPAQPCSNLLTAGRNHAVRFYVCTQVTRYLYGHLACTYSVTMGKLVCCWSDSTLAQKMLCSPFKHLIWINLIALPSSQLALHWNTTNVFRFCFLFWTIFKTMLAFFLR